MAKHRPKHVADNTANKGRKEGRKEGRLNIALSAQRCCFIASTVSLYAKNVNNSEVIHLSITASNM
jgi:hypothetical protein